MANVAALNRELRDDTVEISEMYEKAMVNGLIEKLAEPFNTLIEDLKNVHEIQKGLKVGNATLDILLFSYLGHILLSVDPQEGLYNYVDLKALL
ncbi:hypothetical protein POVCU1_077710 [Plasmodium ovale curtisi]|uniref:Uncharacterized protein n=1 Tax=Plasmodium ovale curtisi TaxID=864141 RepID=A0A1A8XBB5_PLAOA|nr:hypothetical protein POVCU1_077710 [Plasmodium ovale curtisi]